MTQSQFVSKELHIAPMLDVSTREFRQFIRILSRKCVIWTEMIVDETLVHSSNPSEHLCYDEFNTVNVDTDLVKCNDYKMKETSSHPIVCQIGGIQPNDTATAIKFVEQFGYDEVNLNIDCPSSRVSGKQFGAILMKKANSAKAIVCAMKKNAKSIPISVKTRIGIDDFDSFDYLVQFIQELIDCGCYRFIIHSRICILDGLSPAQNRLIPPLNYPRVYALCRRFPSCEFIINGGIPGLKAARQICYGMNSTIITDSVSLSLEQNSHPSKEYQYHSHSVPCSICNISNGSCIFKHATQQDVPSNLKGCMLGRAVMNNPAMFHDVDRYFYGEKQNPCKTRKEALFHYCQYLESVYPRRCCDTDVHVTMNINTSKVTKMSQTQNFCWICTNLYNGKTHIYQYEWCNHEKCSKLKINVGKPIASSSKPTMKSKISSGVIDRSLKPILGIFYGLKCSKSFRRVCDQLSRNLLIRNCGPGFILRLALLSVPEEFLDQIFTNTEHLLAKDVPLHAGPVR